MAGGSDSAAGHSEWATIMQPNPMHRFVNRSKTQHLEELHEPAGPPEQEKPVVDGRCWNQAHECHPQRVFSDKVNYTTSSSGSLRSRPRPVTACLVDHKARTLQRMSRRPALDYASPRWHAETLPRVAPARNGLRNRFLASHHPGASARQPLQPRNPAPSFQASVANPRLTTAATIRGRREGGKNGEKSGKF